MRRTMKLNAGTRNAVHRARRHATVAALSLGILSLLSTTNTHAQQAVAKVAAPVASKPDAAPAAPAYNPGSDYVIGPTDVLTVVIHDEKEITNEVTVRPDGKITLPLVNDIVAAGLTPEQLRRRITDLERQFIKVPVVTVIVKQVNNNRAFITGQVMRPGPYVLSGPTTVMHVLALAGGFTEFADRKRILIMRLENGVQRAFTFNYDDVLKRQDLSQNIILKAGDTVVVP